MRQVDLDYFEEDYILEDGLEKKRRKEKNEL